MNSDILGHNLLTDAPNESESSIDAHRHILKLWELGDEVASGKGLSEATHGSGCTLPL